MKENEKILPVVLAVDGGGSKTEAALVDAAGHVRNYLRVGSTNPNDIGEKAAGERLASLAAAFGGTPAAVSAGVSGAVGHEAALTAAVAAVLPGVPVTVGTDVYNLFGLLPDAGADCAALICGTGAVCFVRKDGILHRIGGWGWLLDSHAGGYAIGRDGLEAALKMHDGRGVQTSLYDAAVSYLGAPPQEIIGKIYEGGKTLIAGFAPCVFAQAQRGDAVAGEVLRRSAAELAQMLARAAEILGEKAFDCIVSGSVICDPQMRSLLEDELENEAWSARLCAADLPQLAGAARNALARCGIVPDRDFDAVFAAEYTERKKNAP